MAEPMSKSRLKRLDVLKAPYARVEFGDGAYEVLTRDDRLVGMFYVSEQTECTEFLQDELARQQAEGTAETYNQAFAAGLAQGKARPNY